MRLVNWCAAGKLVIALLALGPFATVIQADTIRTFKVHNGKAGHDLVEWSKDFTLPASARPTGGDVARWDATTGTWVPEAPGSWGLRASEVRGHAGTWHARFVNRSAAAVPPSTNLRFRVSFNTDDIGAVDGSDRKYDPDQAKKKAGGQVTSFAGDIDQDVFWGGLTGLTIPELNLAIPADTYAYLYQVNALSGNSVTMLQLDNVGSFFGLMQLGASHDGTMEFDLEGDPATGPDDGVPRGGVPTFTGLGTSGISATSWGLIGNTAVATFAGIPPGASSNILVAFSPLGPTHPIEVNTFIGDGISLAPKVTWQPIPEPSSVILISGGLLFLVSRARRHRPAADPLANQT